MTNRNDSASPRTRTGLALALGAAVLLSGCATTANPKDPFEKFNRAMFSFNDTVDRVALKPAATAYKNVTPSFVQTGVNNFFGNLTDLWSSLNNFAQLKGQDGCWTSPPRPACASITRTSARPSDIGACRAVPT